MFQSDNLQLQSTSWTSARHPSYRVQHQKQVELEANSPKLAASLRSKISADVHPNKRAVIERLITLWEKGELH